MGVDVQRSELTILNRLSWPQHVTAKFRNSLGSNWKPGRSVAALEKRFADQNELPAENAVAVAHYGGPTSDGMGRTDEEFFAATSRVNAALNVEAKLLQGQDEIIYRFDPDDEVCGFGGAVRVFRSRDEADAMRAASRPLPEPLSIMYRQQLRRQEQVRKRRQAILGWYCDYGAHSDQMQTWPGTHTGARAIIEFSSHAQAQQAEAELVHKRVACVRTDKALRLPCHEGLSRWDVRFVVWSMVTA